MIKEFKLKINSRIEEIKSMGNFSVLDLVKNDELNLPFFFEAIIEEFFKNKRNN